MIRFATLLALSTLLLTLGACGTARGAFEDATEAEAEGDFATAFDRYHTAIRRDDDERLPGLRERLAEVGNRLVADHLAEVPQATPTRAADLFLTVETYVSRATEVGVTLAVPATFDADRDAAFAQAISALVQSAADARETGAFSDALRHLRDADAYRPTEDERVALDDAARQTYTVWAEDDLANGRFRRAYSSTESALALLAPESEAALAMLDLQREIVDVGSIRAAFFPLDTGSDRDGDRGPVGSPRTEAPFRFVADLDDVLNDDHWTRPPLFVLSADPADVRRLLRRERDAEDLIADRTLIAALARDLDAHVGTAMEVVGWTEFEEVRDRDTRTVDTRDGGRGTYDRVRLRLTLGATVEYAVVDADSRRILCESAISRDVRETITVHEADDWRNLQVSREDRRRFTEDHRLEAEDALHDQLLERLASAVAERVYSCVGQRVP
ncbi:MAG: hypothetical protein AAF791_12670 [Bacteroidota bacterium]